ncbi:MAG: hypothetical protein J6C22_18480 [Bacteroides sp.]|nr:hypothetical protein [Bacteroides sp.]
MEDKSIGLSKEEVIEKLKIISELYLETSRAAYEIKNFTPEDQYERKCVVPTFPGDYENESTCRYLEHSVSHEKDDAVKQMEATYRRTCAPKKPKKLKEPIIKEFANSELRELEIKKDTAKTKSKITLIVGVAILLALLPYFNNILTSLVGIAVFAICAYIFLSSKITVQQAEKTYSEIYNAAMEEYNQQKEKTLSEYEQQVAQQARDYEQRQAEFEQQLSAFLGQYCEWRELYIQHIDEEKMIKEQLENDRKQGANQLYEERYLPAKKKVDQCNDCLSEEYLPVIDTLIELLKRGRADDIKEAINLYEEIQYRERQLELQREQEARRRYEEDRKRQDEERRYGEQMSFQREQERQRQREEKQRRDDEEHRHRDEMSFREKQERERKQQQEAERRRQESERRRQERAEFERKQAEDRERRHQCNTCALSGRCSMRFRRSNCASYRPR